ncbi:hypothetical protein F5878DRAFT_633767 [Lentinula raphanica]|uniref:Uncharacterized protein n=1 Tax=Lentinula raphanica TaxID=153919 RepID=A0AA38NYH6_9AGAR|nr:hypothetical protein F5878DRAFT_633767 [Lentinula raphanica]
MLGYITVGPIITLVVQIKGELRTIKAPQSWSPNSTAPRNHPIKTTSTFLLFTIMILSRSTSTMFLVAIGMITVLSLPVPDEHNLFPSLLATNTQAPAVQEISKRMDASQSGSSLTNPTAQKRPLPEDAAAGSSEPPLKVAKTAKDLPPGAYPPIFKWKGGREFELAPGYNADPTPDMIKKEIEDKIAALEALDICKKKNRNAFWERVKKLKASLTQNLLEEKQDFTNVDFINNMKRLNSYYLLANDVQFRKVTTQLEWIRKNMFHHPGLMTDKRQILLGYMDRIASKKPRPDDLYKLGLAGKDYFGVSYLTEAYVEKLRAVT